MPVAFGGTVPITPFLHGKAFDPAVIRNMSIAFLGVCQQLGLTGKTDPATELVAEKIIELAQQGIHDPARLADAALESFKPDK